MKPAWVDFDEGNKSPEKTKRRFWLDKEWKLYTIRDDVDFENEFTLRPVRPPPR